MRVIIFSEVLLLQLLLELLFIILGTREFQSLKIRFEEDRALLESYLPPWKNVLMFVLIQILREKCLREKNKNINNAFLIKISQVKFYCFFKNYFSRITGF